MSSGGGIRFPASGSPVTKKDGELALVRVDKRSVEHENLISKDMADQQFCLRWNNHQSTLVSVFDSLLERGCLVDCTLAAEGRSLQAHKVVLSACSPYLEDLLSQHYDKHPILLLKDVKFDELQAMMDYMYRGEVNIPQDKLGHFLRAAESLQIKGLSDNGEKEPPDSGGTSSVPSAIKRTVKGIPVVRPATNLSQRKQVNQEVLLDGSSRDGSISPNMKKRRRRGGSVADETEVNDSTRNAPGSHVPPPAAAPATTPSAPSKISLPLVPISESSDPNLGLLSTLMESSQTDNQDSNSSLRDNVMNEKQEPPSEILIEPKTEFIDDENDLTLEDDMDDSLFRPGPSHGQSSYQTGNDSTDEVFMAAQEGGSRDAQGGMQSWLSFKEQLAGMQWPWSYPQVQLPPGVDIIPRSGSGPWPPGRPRGPGSIGMGSQRPPRKDLYACPQCGKVYTWKCSLSLHLRQECGKEPQFQCPHCPHRTKQKGNLEKHIFSKHSDLSYLQHTAPPRGPEQAEQPQPQPQPLSQPQPQPQSQPGPQHQQS